MSQTSGPARFVGSAVKRREDPRLLTGRGSFVDDVSLPGMLHAAFVRSTRASATIEQIDLSAARQLPGVMAVLTLADLLPGEVRGAVAALAPPPLASERVAFVGDPIVVVVARSRAVAEDACEAVVVEYVPSHAVISIADALETGDPVNPDVLGSATGGDPTVDELFNSAAQVVTERVVQQRYIACPMEPRGVVADYRAFPPHATIWVSSQGAHAAREHFADALGLPVHAVRVLVGDVGGAFGLKIRVGREETAIALAARRVGSPVKWIEDRWENLVAAPHAREEEGSFSVALDSEARILAVRLENIENVGAYGYAGRGGSLTVDLITGPYRIEHAAGDTTRVPTNTSTRQAYRGPWLFETLARELVIDSAARTLGMDPLELRRRNVLREPDLPFTMPSGFVLDRISPSETLEQAVRMIDYDGFRAEQAAARELGRYLGLGLSLFVEPTAGRWGLGQTDACTIRIDPSGKVQVLSGVNSQGHSVETTMVQIVADQIGVDIDDVVLIKGDTDAVPVGGTTGGSRNAVFGGGAARQAGAEMRQRILAIAAEMLEASPQDLDIEGGTIAVRGSAQMQVTLPDVAKIAYSSPESLPSDVAPGLEVTSRFTTERHTFSNAAHICTCEVDPVSGKVTLLRYVVSEDCGTMINPKVVEGQVCGGVVQGLGGVLFEHFIYDEDGNPLTTTFMDYLLPTVPEVPTIEIGHIETPSRHEGGWKGMGEGGAIGAPVALVNAVADALHPLGVKINRLPLTPSLLVEMIAAADSGMPRG